jgi:predicted PurR-regulated permease PerM
MISSTAALALVAAVGELVPNPGPIIAAIPLITVGFLSSPSQGLLATALAILVQQLENNLIVPRVMGQAVNQPPVVASLSVILDEIQRERLARHPLGSDRLHEPPDWDSAA